MPTYPAQRPEGYYQDPRECLLQFVCEGPNRVLDVGCGEGRTGAALKAAGKAQEVVGIEKDQAIADMASDRLDWIVCADVETAELQFDECYFDYVILADVLEHLVNPWAVVTKLTPYVAGGGRMIASVPNVRYWRVLLPLLLKGEWKYRANGVLDDTHLRFFTRKTVVELFASDGLVLNRILPEFQLLPKSKSDRFNRSTCALFEDLLTMRYVVDVVKKEHESDAASATGGKPTL